MNSKIPVTRRQSIVMVALAAVVTALLVAVLSSGSGPSPNFTFGSDEAGISFTCKLDNGTTGPCSSPLSLTGLSPGAHIETIVGAFTVPAPAGPVANFTYSPSAPTTGSPVTFSATDTTTDCPCSYAWSDDGGTTRPIPPTHPLGSTNPLAFTFQAAATKYVRLVVTGSDGQTATTERNVVVSAGTTSSSSSSSTSTTTSSTTTTTSTTTAAGCTVTDSTLASIVSDSASLPDGAKLCIADGAYGQLNLTATRTGYVTIAAANQGKAIFSGLDVASRAAFLHLDGLKITSNSIFGDKINSGSAPHDMIVTNSDSAGWDVEAGGVNYVFDHDSSHDGPYGWLLNGSVHPSPGGCCSTANYPLIKNVTIENSTITRPGADAFQIKGFDGVVVKNNDISNVVQNGNHNDGVQTVHGGANLTIDHNVFRDGNVELFMIKDGSIKGVTITDNLAVNNSAANNPPCGGCGVNVTGNIFGPYNVTIQRNTFLQPGLQLTNYPTLVGNGNPDYLPVQNVLVDHNVITMFRPSDATQGNAEGVFKTAMTESFNVFGTWTTNWLTPASTDTVSNSPTFKCSPGCSGLSDYELASNPNHIGIDWNPATQVYGPTP